jgi:hypothetical protein
MNGVRHLFFTALALLALTARAQVTEDPTTVAPGRFLLEMDALSFKVNHDQGNNYTAVGAASTFLSTGITKNWDVQVGVNLFINEKFSSNNTTERHSGLGDLYLRTKWRFYEGDTVDMAILPYVKLPTSSGGVSSGDALEGGVILPWQAHLIGEIALTAMVGLDLKRNDADNGYDSYWYTSMALSRHLFGGVGLYGEGAAAKSSGGAPWEGTLGLGLTWNINKDMWWDLALYRGVSAGASDWNPVLRFNLRF